MIRVSLRSSSAYNQFSRLCEYIPDVEIKSEESRVYIVKKRDINFKGHRFLIYLVLNEADPTQTRISLQREKALWNGKASEHRYTEGEVHAIANENLLHSIDRILHPKLWQSRNLISSQIQNGNHFDCTKKYSVKLEYKLKALDDPEEKRVDLVTIGFKSFIFPQA